jgi:hypothetical protein
MHRTLKTAGALAASALILLHLADAQAWADHWRRAGLTAGGGTARHAGLTVRSVIGQSVAGESASGALQVCAGLICGAHTTVATAEAPSERIWLPIVGR